ncbi:MAG: adenosine deaminase [Candidatus Bathyarchaeota archaeon]|nr:adenosine deaminase [Candidatus Bathyarchaeota archaeon]
MDTEEIIRRLPKIEQHVHIVGSTKPETLLRIIEDSGAETKLKTLDDIKGFFRYRDFPHFISVYSTVNDCIIDEKYYEQITYEMLESDAGCNVKHVEAIFSANDHVRRGLDYGEMLDAINRGIRRAKRKWGITCTIRVDLVRNYGPGSALTQLDWLRKKGDNIVAVDIGGSEDGFPPEPYEAVYKKARDLDLHLVAHAGEAAGPESVWGAVKTLGVERIGHGVTAASDPELLRELRTRGVGIETCPVSNLRTGAIKTMKEHPIRSFIKNGIKVSVNSDDPPMFNTEMNNEYLQLHRELGFSVDELMRISLDSIETSFLPAKKKEELREKFLVEYRGLVSKG